MAKPVGILFGVFTPPAVLNRLRGVYVRMHVELFRCWHLGLLNGIVERRLWMKRQLKWEDD
jgi:hypothetical protein